MLQRILSALSALTSKQKIAGASVIVVGLWFVSLIVCSGTTWIIADQFGTRRVVIQHEGGGVFNMSKADLQMMGKMAEITTEQNNAKVAALEAHSVADKSKDPEARKRADELEKFAYSDVWQSKRDAIRKAK